MTGAEITVLSRTIAKYSLACAVVHVANRFLPFSLSTKLTVRRPCWSLPTFALWSSSPPNRTHGAVRAAARRAGTLVSTISGAPCAGGVIEVGIGTNWSWPVWPTSFRIASVSLMPGTSTTILSVPGGHDHRLGHAGRVHAPLDDLLDDLDVRERRDLSPFGSTRYSTFSPP